MENYFEFVDTNREQFMALLKSNEFKCNAAGRRFMAERVKLSKSRPVTVDMDTLRYAEEIGGLKPGSEFTLPVTDTAGLRLLEEEEPATK